MENEDPKIEQATHFIKRRMAATGVMDIEAVIDWLHSKRAFRLDLLDGWGDFSGVQQLVFLLAQQEDGPGQAMTRAGFAFVASVSPKAELARIRQILRASDFPTD